MVSGISTLLRSATRKLGQLSPGATQARIKAWRLQADLLGLGLSSGKAATDALVAG